ncbi:UbiA prenyltransferase family-domain-containing protein [Apodospora peruviana]|uniref:Protoheme IX farnesyltransferase, mitochondrial n=1 Tax=Apodospora peruviana TaxID=516989 RepID=A0AAE0IB31_9PEZI|nr:UbiA prenyltransferase family-domain-containing protein [Apodospora peruviana]
MRPPISTIRPSVLDDVCWRCTQHLQLQQHVQLHLARSSKSTTSAQIAAARSTRRFFSKASPPRASASQSFGAGYFLSNALLTRGRSTIAPSTGGGGSSSTRLPEASRNAGTTTADSAAAAAAATIISLESETTILPHRRRQAAAAKHRIATPDAADDSPTSSLPPDASSILAGVAARHPADSLRRKLSAFLSLSKPRLTVLVVLSAMVPYALYPVPAFLSSSALVDAAPSLSPLTLLFLTTGTTLCSAAANALNMLYEPDTDSKMSRTRTRPLVRKLLTTRAAVLFAVGCGVAGTAALYLGVNPTVSFLGAANIALYAGAYTPLKRISAVNTWVGAIVGGIPPLMGWAAAAGESATADGGWRELLFAVDGSSLGGWLFAGLLFAWQFPHFMPLSWGIREEYKAAGLRMLCWVNPARNARVALRYSLVFVPLCVGLCAAGVTEWSFAVTSAPVNLWLISEAVKFWRFEGHKGSARGLFWASVWHLPVVMVLALAQKKGMWGRVWRSVTGEPLQDEGAEDEEWEEEEEDES